VSELAEARKALGKREGLSEKNHEKHIAVWSASDKHDPEPSSIRAWAQSLGLTAVVWTALPPQFRDKDGRIPTAEEAVQYLRDLPHEQRRNAERYIRMTPRQVDTAYRRRFELEFGWTPLAGS
jgi:hypothetical protein